MSYFLIDKTGSVGHTEFLEGNTGGPVGPDGSGVINLIGDTSEGISIAGDPGTNTLTVSAHPISGTGTTVDAAFTSLFSFSLGATAGTFLFTVSIVGYETTIPGLVSIRLFATVATNGTNAFSEDPLSASYSTTNGLEAAIFQSGFAPNNFSIGVRGVAGFTIDWKATATYTRTD